MRENRPGAFQLDLNQKGIPAPAGEEDLTRLRTARDAAVRAAQDALEQYLANQGSRTRLG